MQVGFFFWPFGPALVRRLAAAAERHGYDLVGIADTPANAMDPWVAATLVAAATTRPRIALCVSNLLTRHPAVSAAAIASLDLVAPGRAILGLGRSGLAALAQGTRTIRALLAGERVGGASLPWVARPSPVFLAASGPRALAVAGECADGAFVNYGIAAATLAASEAAVAAAGRAVETWQIAALDCDEDAAAARRRIGAILAFMAE